jgi:DNA invertase Pin-like site-specific DNA recombinase
MKIAIYSRKSVFSSKGESIENQIQLCREYCEKNYPDEKIDYIIYEDEGFSGGNTNRPQFQKLLEHAKLKKFNALICYRLDRISRNVADFSTTLELLQSNNIDFISIKEQFDTSTPMGRAMVYISSVFAQLERETIAERVRDNMLQLAKTGRWLGGQVPTGFDSEKISYLDAEMKEKTLVKLIPNKDELNIVKFIFDTYLKEQSIREVTRQLNMNGIKGKNDGNYDVTQVRRILRNPLYVKSDKSTHDYLNNMGTNVFGEYNGNGYITYNKKKQTTIGRDVSEWIVAIAKHKGIIDSNSWLKIQSILNKNKDKQSMRLGTGNSNNACFAGVLKCAKCGANMIVKHGHASKITNGKKYDYYVCSNKLNKFVSKCDNPNIRVDRLDPLVISQIKNYNKKILIEELEKSITNNDTSVENKQLKELNAKIEEKRLASSNLVKRLSLAPNDTVSGIIMDEISNITTEITELEQTLNDIKSGKNEINKQVMDLELVIDALKHFNENIDTVDDINRKRILVQTVSNNILWNGDTYEADVKIMGMSDSKKK